MRRRARTKRHNRNGRERTGRRRERKACARTLLCSFLAWYNWRRSRSTSCAFRVSSSIAPTFAGFSSPPSPSLPSPTSPVPFTAAAIAGAPPGPRGGVLGGVTPDALAALRLRNLARRSVIIPMFSSRFEGCACAYTSYKRDREPASRAGGQIENGECIANALKREMTWWSEHRQTRYGSAALTGDGAGAAGVGRWHEGGRECTRTWYRAVQPPREKRTANENTTSEKTCDAGGG